MTAGQHIPAFFFFYVSKLIMCQVSVEYMTEHTIIMLCVKNGKVKQNVKIKVEQVGNRFATAALVA
jgi:hypothetical protein